MSLEELYSKFGIPAKDRIQNPKNILLLTPSVEYDFADDLKALKIDKKEISFTYPKRKENPNGLMAAELKYTKAALAIQVGGFIADARLPTLPMGGEPSDKLKQLVDKAIGDKFVNLHHHDEYSIRDGLGTNKQLIEKLKKNKRSFCSVTNHGSLAGWIKQHTNCKKADIKSIFGCEMYHENYRGTDPAEKKNHRHASHLLTIAKNEEGFYNLIKLHNDAQLNGFYYSPRTCNESLKKWGKGIISSTTCAVGNIPKCLDKDDKAGALDWYNLYKSCFDEFYVELPMIEWDWQVRMNSKLIQFAQEVGAPLIVTLDSHYVEKEHSETHDVLMLIRDKKTKLDLIENKEEVWQFETRNLYYRTEQELRSLWDEGFQQKKEYTEDNEIKVRYDHCLYKSDIFTKEVLDRAIENTRDIALRCEEMKLDSTLKLPKMYPNGEEILIQKAWENFKKKGLDTKGVKYKERLEFELRVINDLGYADYFLTLEKIISETVKEFGEFSVNWGRGSGAGSLVSFCLGITDIDPLEYGLLFERFLDYSRRPVSVCSFKV